MAIAANWVVNGTVVTSSALIYTVPTASTVPYGTLNYNRDLVVTNGGPSTVFIGLGTGVTAAATTSSFAVPSGGTVVLTQCQVSTGLILSAISAGTSTTYVGFGTNVAYV